MSNKDAIEAFGLGEIRVDPPRCQVCGEDGNLHVCIPVVIQMLLNSSGFRELVKTVVEEEITTRAVEGVAPVGEKQMLDDLKRLATDDGCIAAAWAFEWITDKMADCDESTAYKAD